MQHHVVWTALLLLASPAAADLLEPREPVATSRFFVFYSHFDFNLYDILLASAAARRSHRAEPFQGAARECFDQLTREERSAWDTAVDYFAATIGSTRNFSHERSLFRAVLSGQDPELEAEDRQALDLGSLFLRAAAPAYRACRWPDQDRANREWVAELMPRLERFDTAIKTRLEELFGESWQTLPIPVDAVEDGGRNGADTYTRPRTHSRISSRNPGYEGLAALEMIFHEASHELVGSRSGTTAETLARAAKETGTAVPFNLWHGVLFITVGEVTRSELAKSGESGYVPAMVAQDIFTSMIEPLTTAWVPFVRGETDRATAAEALLEAMAESAP